MSARESDVERFLRGYGKVRDISLKRGYGFVVRRIRIVPCFRHDVFLWWPSVVVKSKLTFYL